MSDPQPAATGAASSLSTLSVDAKLRRLVEVGRQIRELDTRRSIFQFYPDDDQPGFPARWRYHKHLEILREGVYYFSRLILAGNGCGKTESIGGYETICHLRGWYPPWWEGHRFTRPISCIIAGETFETTRDIQQKKLLGLPKHEGTGMIPAEWIDFGSIIRETQGAIDQFCIKHISGLRSQVSFKSYKQGIDSFMGQEIDLIWLDEIAPRDIYGECAARTRNRMGARMLTTFTPKKGKTPLVRMFLEEPADTRKWYKIGWDSAPHLSELDKKEILENTPKHMIATVRDGEPSQGAGAVYPVSWDSIKVEPFTIPAHWRWVVGFDGGFYNTAFVWLAWDPDTDTVYVVSDYCDGGVDPKSGPIDVSVHAARFKARSKALFGNEKLPVIGDAAAVDQTDGKKVCEDYHKNYGIHITLPVKAPEAGVAVILERMVNGKFKVFSTCIGWKSEFEGYHREYDEVTETSKIRKQRDHRMDATRYPVHGGLRLAVAKYDMRENQVQIAGVGIRR